MGVPFLQWLAPAAAAATAATAATEVVAADESDGRGGFWPR